MTNLEMFYFVGRCLSIDEHPEFRDVILQKISDDEIEWAQFVSLCSSHLVLPVIYLKFKSHQLIEHLPEELAEFLKEIYDLNFARNEQILLQINDILKLLNANEIYPTFLKGTGNLLDGLYSDKGERMIGDIDFLVLEEDYLKAARLLEEDGYAMVNKFKGDVLKEKHYPRLFKTDVLADVEVHHLLVPHQYASMFNPEMIYTKNISLDGDNYCLVLEDEHKVILNFIHSQLANNGHVHGIISLRDIYDLYLIAKRIELLSFINKIPFKRKAISYFVFSGNALNLPKLFYSQRTISSKILIIRHSLNYTFPVFYKIYPIIVFLLRRILKVYLKLFLQAIYSKEIRHSVVYRITKRQWYSDHFKFYRNYFKINL